jgi:deoxyxylulose-5-phosphate synthase
MGPSLVRSFKFAIRTMPNPVDLTNYPLLSGINVPEDLRKLDEVRLEQVCKELRDFIIDVVSVKGGHFGASLGVVELTVALHYVFNTPYDQLVWDVGHQAYGHKILTGRRDLFHTNRLYKGISGFPKRSEHRPERRCAEGIPDGHHHEPHLQPREG